MRCRICGSFALNLEREGIDQGDLCDRHYWQDRAEKAEQDAARLKVLLNMRPIDAQAIFWNYSNKKARIKAIDEIMEGV